ESPCSANESLSLHPLVTNIAISTPTTTITRAAINTSSRRALFAAPDFAMNSPLHWYYAASYIRRNVVVESGQLSAAHEPMVTHSAVTRPAIPANVTATGNTATAAVTPYRARRRSTPLASAHVDGNQRNRNSTASRLIAKDSAGASSIPAERNAACTLALPCCLAAVASAANSTSTRTAGGAARNNGTNGNARATASANNTSRW